MFAEVYPLVKLPRRFSFFDYKIPKELDVEVGDIVRVPLRGRPILAVIKSKKEKSEFDKVLNIQEIIFPEFLSAEDLERFETIGHAIAQSTSSILHLTFGQLKGRGLGSYLLPKVATSLSVSPETVELIKETLSKDSKEIYAQLSEEGQYTLVHATRRKFKNQILIICPRERDAQQLSENLNLGPKTAVIHGKTLATKRESIIRSWQNGNIDTLIGTRQATLLSAQKLDAVIILDCSSEDYRNLNRNPRIDARKAAQLLAKQHDAQLFYAGITPIITIIDNKNNTWQKPFDFKLIEIKAQEESTGHAMITESLLESIRHSLQNRKKVLLSFNRKGVAKRLQCAACDHIPLCGTCGAVPIIRNEDLVCTTCKTEMWIPENCPSCGSKKLSQKGVGNKKIMASLQKLIPEAKVGTIDKESQNEDADILIVTEYYFKNIYKPFMQKSFGTVASLNIDFALAGADFRSSEIALYKLHRLISIAKRENAECIIQTWLPELIKPMKHLKTFLETELETRKSYSLPPSVDLAKITCEKDNVNEVIKNPDLNKLKNKEDHCIIETDLKSYDVKNSPNKS